MGTFAFKLPDIGEGIAEAEIVAWHVKVGDVVEEDDPLCDMMTDKATVEMTAPVSGTVVKIAGDVGDQIAIGAVLAEFETEAEAKAEPLVQVAPNDAAQAALSDPEPILPETGRGTAAEGGGGGAGTQKVPPLEPPLDHQPAADGASPRTGTDHRKVLASPRRSRPRP